MGIEDRLGYVQDAPRTLTKVAPYRLRAFVAQELVKSVGPKQAYLRLCELANEAPDPDVQSPEWAAERVPAAVEKLPWIEVYRIIEQIAAGPVRLTWPGTGTGFELRVNEVLAACGVAYEVVGKRVRPFSPPVDGLELDTPNLAAIDDRFAPALDQYRRAQLALDQVPEDYHSAVREAANAVEAAAKILSGKPKATLQPALDTLFGNGAPFYQRRLQDVMVQVYAYSSQAPGVRHAQHEIVVLSRAEAEFAVRVAGAAIEFLVREFG